MSAQHPTPVLEYAQPVNRRRAVVRSPMWAAIAPIAAAVYAGLAACLVGLLGTWIEPHTREDAQAVLLVLLAMTSPLGIVAALICVFGHYSPGGRLRAGPALWMVGVTPGGAAALYLIVTVFRSFASEAVVLTCSGIIALNVAILAVLRGRILKASPEELRSERGSG